MLEQAPAHPVRPAHPRLGPGAVERLTMSKSLHREIPGRARAAVAISAGLDAFVIASREVAPEVPSFSDVLGGMHSGRCGSLFTLTECARSCAHLQLLGPALGAGRFGDETFVERQALGSSILFGLEGSGTPAGYRLHL